MIHNKCKLWGVGLSKPVRCTMYIVTNSIPLKTTADQNFIEKICTYILCLFKNEIDNKINDYKNYSKYPP